jgi:hypothetical protein
MMNGWNKDYWNTNDEVAYWYWWWYLVRDETKDVFVEWRKFIAEFRDFSEGRK